MKCEVIRAISVLPSEKELKDLKARADTKGIRFDPNGFTTMVYLNKKKLGKDGKTWLEPEPVFVELPIESARARQAVGAVRVVI